LLRLPSFNPRLAMPATALRPRSVSEIADVAFQIYRTHFATLVMCTGLAYVPSLALRLLVVGDLTRIAAGQMTASSRFLSLTVMSAVVGMLSFALMSAIVTVYASQVYLGEPVDVSAAVRRTIARLVPLLVVTLVVSLFIGFGLVFFIAPGIYAVARWFAVTPAVLLEDRGAGAAMSRSSALSRDRKWHILGALLLILLIYFVVVTGISVVTALGTAALAGRPGILAQTMLASIAVICIYPIIPITVLLLYYDARIQTEGLDIELMADALGGMPSTPAATAS
jgi:hypothetical protein